MRLRIDPRRQSPRDQLADRPAGDGQELGADDDRVHARPGFAAAAAGGCGGAVSPPRGPLELANRRRGRDRGPHGPTARPAAALRSNYRRFAYRAVTVNSSEPKPGVY